MSSNTTSQLSIDDVVYRGKGLARTAAGVVFVPDTLPCETVEVEIVRQARNFAEARLVRVVHPSATRITPACPLAGVCPGCRYQHASYEEEVRLKQAQLANLLGRMAGEDPSLCLPPVPSPRPLGYRNKIGLHGAVQSGRPVLGYFAEDNVTVLDVEQCPLAMAALNERLAWLRADAAFMAAVRDHLLLTLRFTSCDGVTHWTGKQPAPKPWLTESSAIGDLHVPRGSFFQVNPPVADALLQRFQSVVKESGCEAAADLYCGAGVFTLAAALAGVPLSIGVDADGEAIQAAVQNAADRDLSGVRFRVGSADALLKQAAAPMLGRRWMLVVDPPRMGLTQSLIQGISRTLPDQIVYVSCAADTLARDIRRLAAAGYALASAQLFDMFPRTPYFETLAVLRRRM